MRLVCATWIGLAGLPAAASVYECGDERVDVDLVLCEAPRVLYQRLIGSLEPGNDVERAVLAAALLAAEIEALGPPARAGNEAARERRNDNASRTRCLERHFEGLHAAGTPFVYQWQVLSGQLQGAGEQYLIPSLRALWREWNVGNRAAERAQDDAARVLLEVSPSFQVQRRPPPLASLEELHYWPFESAERLDMETLDELAVDALLRARRASLATNHIEWGGYLLLEDDTHYRTPRPVPGRPASLPTETKWKGLVLEDLARQTETSYRLCSRYRIVASYHVHPPLPPVSLMRQLLMPGATVGDMLWHQFIEWFSADDVDVALSQGVPEYIITPSCTVRVLTPSEEVRGASAVTEYAGGLPAVNWTRHVRTVPHDRDCDAPD